MRRHRHVPRISQHDTSNRDQLLAEIYDLECELKKIKLMLAEPWLLTMSFIAHILLTAAYNALRIYIDNLKGMAPENRLTQASIFYSYKQYLNATVQLETNFTKTLNTSWNLDSFAQTNHQNIQIFSHAYQNIAEPLMLALKQFFVDALNALKPGSMKFGFISQLVNATTLTHLLILLRQVHTVAPSLEKLAHRLHPIVWDITNRILALLPTAVIKRSIFNSLAQSYYPFKWHLPEKTPLPTHYYLLNTEELASEKERLQNINQRLKTHSKDIRRKNLLAWSVYSGLILLNYINQSEMYQETTAALSITISIIPKLMLAALQIPFISGSAVFLIFHQFVFPRVYQDIWLPTKLNQIQNQFNTIFERIKGHYKVEIKNHGSTETSYLNIQVNNNYHHLESKYIADAIKLTLHHFNIPLLPAYSRRCFAIAGNTAFGNVVAMKHFFETALERSRHIKLLDTQINAICEKLYRYKNIYIENRLEFDANGHYQKKLILKDLADLAHVLAHFGFHKHGNDLILIRTTPFEDTQAIIKAICDYYLRDEAKRSPQPAQPAATAKQYRPAGNAAASKQHEEKQQSQPLANQARIINWLMANASYPSLHPKEVVPVDGAINCYMLWRLPLAAFGGDNDAAKAFHEKRSQMAPANKNAQGIKYGKYLGMDFETGKQRFFDARIKLVSDTYGDAGVLLDTETAPTGERLFVARGFQYGIH